MTTAKIHFSKEKETMLITLGGRAIQSQWKQPILRDPWAVEAMRHIDYDIRKGFGGFSYRLFGKMGCTVIATRGATFDLLTNRYLADHPNATVLHLGCGMDSRVFRVDPPASVNWFDVDYPDVIALRHQLFPERKGNYHMIGAPLDDLHWLDDLPRDQPVLLLAEGVFQYLGEADVKALLNAVVAHFPSGQVVFDACHPMIVKRRGSNVGGTGATFRWGLDDPQDIRQLEPKLQLIKEWSMHELVGFDRFSLGVRALLRAQDMNPTLRRLNRIVVYRF